MKYLKSYSIFEASVNEEITKLIYYLQRNNDWVEIENAKKIYPDSICAYEYTLVKDKYKLMLLVRKNKDVSTAILYFKDVLLNQLNYLESITTPIVKIYDDNKLDFCIRLGNKQLEYYKSMDKMPTREDINSIFLELVDNDLSIDEVLYGYTKPDFPNDVDQGWWDRDVYYHNDGQYYKFKCVIYLQSAGLIENIEEFNKDFEFCKERLIMDYKVSCKMTIWENKYVMIVLENL